MTCSPLFDLEELNISQKSDLILEPRYRANIDSVTPLSARKTFEKLDSCFLGISLNNSNFEPAKFKAIVEWISRKFSHCILLIGDSMHRITLEITRSLEPEIAVAEALKMGSSFIQENEHIFSTVERQTTFVFETCSQIKTSKDYVYFYSGLQAYFENDTKFRSSIEAFGRKYHTNPLRNLNNDLLEQHIRLSCEYFLEEFAIIACLQKRGFPVRGFPVMLYPGSIGPLLEIANGEHPDICEELKQLVIVALKFKKR
ncbi:tRNA-dependent cyclodipeptide synthase [Microcoleus sp. MON1_C1]|uniref:tRNA-dependent cyclodipeptide synthase n=1 Tax=Microcoleus sp. MON1_C1 TaxID=2818827 RepID=UPI002FD55F96